MTEEKVFLMSTARVYSCLVQKAERKGRTRAEVDAVTCWLTGYSEAELYRKLEEDVPYGEFFRRAPAAEQNMQKVTGSVCGIKVQEIENPTMRQIRCLDKLVDELAKGKPMEKIIRD